MTVLICGHFGADLPKVHNNQLMPWPLVAFFDYPNAGFYGLSAPAKQTVCMHIVMRVKY